MMAIHAEIQKPKPLRVIFFPLPQLAALFALSIYVQLSKIFSFVIKLTSISKGTIRLPRKILRTKTLILTHNTLSSGINTDALFLGLLNSCI